MTLKSALDDISREISIPDDVVGAALRLAGRRRARRRAVAPAAAIAAVAMIAVVVLAVTSVVGRGGAGVRPAGPVSGPGSVPSHVSAPQAVVRSVFAAPIFRAALLYLDRHSMPILISADGNDVRSLPVPAVGAYRGVSFALSPDGTKVAYGWAADDFTKVKKGSPQSEIRIVTLATGRTVRLALPGAGVGDSVDHIIWSADGTRLLVQAEVISEVTSNDSGSGWVGTIETFIVDAATATREGSVPVNDAFLAGWSRDGKRLLSTKNDLLQITDLAGNSLRTLGVKAIPGTGGYGDATNGDGLNWSPDEKTMAMAVGKALPGHPLTTYDGSSRPFLLRALSLGPAERGGDAAESDVPLGSAQAAFVIGWADDTHVLVDLWLDRGAQRVESVDVRSGAVATVITVDPGLVSARGVGVAADIVRAGGFR